MFLASRSAPWLSRLSTASICRQDEATCSGDACCCTRQTRCGAWDNAKSASIHPRDTYSIACFDIGATHQQKVNHWTRPCSCGDMKRHGALHTHPQQRTQPRRTVHTDSLGRFTSAPIWMAAVAARVSSARTALASAFIDQTKQTQHMRESSDSTIDPEAS